MENTKKRRLILIITICEFRTCIHNDILLTQAVSYKKGEIDGTFFRISLYSGYSVTGWTMNKQRRE